MKAEIGTIGDGLWLARVPETVSSWVRILAITLGVEIALERNHCKRFQFYINFNIAYGLFYVIYEAVLKQQLLRGFELGLLECEESS